MGRNSTRIVDFCPNDGFAIGSGKIDGASAKPTISAVIFPRVHVKAAKTFWQHSGDGISSRRAEYCHKAFDDGRLGAWRGPTEAQSASPVLPPSKGPRRYRKKDSIDSSPKQKSSAEGGHDGIDCVRFVEERFGRNLDLSLASSAKLAIRRRIACALTADVDLHKALEMSQTPTRTANVKGFSEDDVYLYPCGMSSIFNTHESMMACKGHMKSISFG